MFDWMGPQAVRLSEERVKNYLMKYGLPDSVMDKIMELSDQDKDGFFDKPEFSVAFHLTLRAAAGDEIPDEIYISVQRCQIQSRGGST